MRLYNAASCTPVGFAGTSRTSLNSTLPSKHPFIPRSNDVRLPPTSSRSKPKVPIESNTSAYTTTYPTDAECLPALKRSSTNSTSMSSDNMIGEAKMFSSAKDHVTKDDKAAFATVPWLRDFESIMQKSLAVVTDTPFDLKEPDQSDASTLTALSTFSSICSIEEAPILGSECNKTGTTEYKTTCPASSDAFLEKERNWPKKLGNDHGLTLVKPYHLSRLPEREIKNQKSRLDQSKMSFCTSVELTPTFPSTPVEPVDEDLGGARSRLRKVARKAFSKVRVDKKTLSMPSQQHAKTNVKRANGVSKLLIARNVGVKTHQASAPSPPSMNDMIVTKATGLYFLPLAEAIQESSDLPNGSCQLSVPDLLPKNVTGDVEEAKNCRLKVKVQSLQRQLQPSNRRFTSNEENHMSHLQTDTLQTTSERPQLSPCAPPTKPEEAAMLAKYTNMMKMGLPIGAIKNAMMRDGIDPSLINRETGARILEQHKTEAAPKDKYRRTRLHWESHDGFSSNTIWAILKRDSDITAIHIDNEEFGSLFQAELRTAIISPAHKSTDHGSVKVIDPKRANNGGIILARVKLSYIEIAQAIDALDQDAMTTEQIRGLLRCIPTAEERRALISYMSTVGFSLSSLCECEKFMIAIMNVRHATRKLHALLFMQGLPSSLQEIRKDAQMVRKACHEIMCSSRFRKTLGIILDLGNRLNTAGSSAKEMAGAITINSLLKLNQAKAFDQKTTFLHFVVKIIRSNKATLLHFRDELPTVFKAEKTQWDQSVLEMERLEKELDEVRKIALHQIGHCQSTGDDDAQTLVISSLPLSKEVEVLQSSSIGRFTLDACVEMAVLVNEVEKSKEQFTTLLSYFGEAESKMRPDEVFKTISTFSKNFDFALDEVIEIEKVKMKELRLIPSRTADINATFSSDEGAKGTDAPAKTESQRINAPFPCKDKSKSIFERKRHKGRDF